MVVILSEWWVISSEWWSVPTTVGTSLDTVAIWYIAFNAVH